MRIGEIRNIIRAVTDENGLILINADPIYGGQAYAVRNFKALVDAINIIANQSWNEFDFSPLKLVFDKYTKDRKHIPKGVDMELADYNVLSTYVETVNTKMPTYVSVVWSLAQDQDPQVINIKIPEKYKTINNLTEFNNRLEKLFKIIDIDGDGAVFKGFDKGSDWYVVCLAGSETYHAFLASLELAQQFFTTKIEYYKSKKARLDYEAALAIQPDGKATNTDTGFEQFKEKRMDLELEEEAKKVVEDITQPNGREHSELVTQVIKEVKGLINEMGEGVEFHLSLNPPGYATEEGGLLSIDYKKIAEHNQEQKRLEEESKQLEAPKEKTEKPEKPETPATK